MFNAEDVKDELGNTVNNSIGENVAKANIFEYFISVLIDEFVKADIEKSFFVNAGPGTGKTHSITEKLNHLVSYLDLDADCIQVLTFTNSAVKVLKQRLNEKVKRDGSRSLRNIDIRTFDSFAWYVIRCAEDNNWINTDYTKKLFNFEANIVKATSIVRNHNEILRDWKYFIVDEIQDLTSVRASFIIEIIKACKTEGL